MSQRHFKKEIGISFRTKAFSLFALLFCVFLVGSSFIGIDTNTHTEHEAACAPSMEQGYFVQEEVPGKFKMLKAIFEGEEVILRPDRIELLLRKSKMQESSFLLFENSNANVQPMGINQIDVSTKPILNKAMAEVLNASSMQVTRFEKVKYSNLYDGVDLLLTVGAKGINAELISDSAVDASNKFKMSVLADTKVVRDKNSLNFNHNRSTSKMMIKSNKNLNINNSNKLEFSEINNSPGNLNFEIILK